MPLDETQLSALISAAVQEAVDRTTRELAAKFEAENEGLRRSRDTILAEKKAVEGKQPVQTTLDNFDEWLAGVDERMRNHREESDRLLGKSPLAAAITAPREMTITREECRNNQAYREAKAAAEKAGVKLIIVDEHRPAPGPAATSRVKYVEDAGSRTLYANKDVLREAGGLQRLKETAERDGKRVVVFRSTNDLPTHVARAHAEILAAKKPDTLLDGGE